jgi:hypothetical protein
MKKILYLLLVVGAMSSASSCKKCGYCQYPNGGGNSEAVCKDNSLGGLLDNYKEAQAQCDADGGTWVNTK